jgi:hypothetical protein
MSMERRRRLRTRGLAAFTAVLAILIAVPAAASAQGNIVNDLLKGLGLGSNGGGDATPAAPVPPNYQPPLHGSNPHGQGTVGVVDLNPSAGVQNGDPALGAEEVVIGDSQSAQDSNGNYQGRVTLLHLHLLGLVNFPAIIENRTSEGQSKSGPLSGLQTDVLDAVCNALTQPDGCVTVLQMDSTTDSTGSKNDFRVAGVNLPGVLNVGAAESHSEIRETSTCQTATGSSSVANANVLGTPVGLVNAGVMNASSSSQACNDGTSSQTNDSDVATLNNLNLVSILPAGGQCGTADQPGPGSPATPDTTVLDLLPLVDVMCAADDSNGAGESAAQTGSPYGVRESLTVFALNLGGVLGILPVKAAVSGPESHAVAPAATTPPGENPGGNNGGGNEGEGGGGGGGGNPGGGPTSTVAQPGGGELAFTGANLGLLSVLGLALILGGLGIARASTRRHQRATA